MEKIILGLTEEIIIVGPNQEKIIARIDTGATSSSLDLELAKKIGLRPGSKVKIVKSASGIKERPIVTVKVNLQNLPIEEEFTLANRSHMTYLVLIGQNILKRGNFLIDPNKE